MNISYFVFGYAEVAVCGEGVLRLINACMKYNLPYGKTRRDGESVIFIFRLFHLSDLKRVCKACGVEYELKRIGGLPSRIYKSRHRYGLWAGLACAVLLLVLSQKFIWRIEVVGNESITTGEILSILDGHDFRVGSYIPDVNADKLQNSLLIASDKISWISVNINGNTAIVEVRERVSGKDEASNNPANLVASKGGEITHVQVMKGNVVVKKGDYVKEGDLLVSGIFDIRDDGFRLTRAEGLVYARTSEEFYIKIPYQYTKKAYTGVQYCDEYLNFFDFSIKISKNSRNSGYFYDKISIMDNYNFPDGAQLPVYKSRELYYEYENVTAYRSVAEAEELAYFELSGKIRDLTADATMLKKIIVPEIHDDFFALRCVVVCVENIAQTEEFEVG